MDKAEINTPISAIKYSSPLNIEIDQYNGSTPTKNSRTNRMFRVNSQTNLSAITTMSKLPSPTQRTINSSRIRLLSPQGCQLYYKQSFASQRLPITVFKQNLSPQKLHLVKSAQILQYQNNVLRKQIQKRDEIILMYKKGWPPNCTPINDNYIKSLNLKLAQKNVLIQQIHRNLIEYQQYLTKQKQYISSIYMQRLKILIQLVESHQHYPIIIRQRIIQTSRAAQKIFIHQPMNNLNQWQLKIQNQYTELKTIKQKLDWFQKQNKILQSTITGLKVQNSLSFNEDTHIYKVQIQKLTNQILLHQQQVAIYRQNVVNLSLYIQQIQKKQPIVNNLKQNQILLQLQCIKSHNKSLEITLQSKKAQILLIKEKIIKQSQQLSGSQQRYHNIVLQNNSLKYQIGVSDNKIKQLQNLIVNYKVKQQQNNLSNIKIIEFNNEITKLSQKINSLGNEKEMVEKNVSQWKKHCQDAQNYIQKLLKDLQILKQQRQNQNKINFQLQQKTQKSQRNKFEQVKNLKNFYQTIITKLKNQNAQRKQIMDKNQYYYKIDGRYSQIKQKLIQLSRKNSQSFLKQQQLIQKIKQSRKQDIQKVQKITKQMLSIIGNIQQFIVIKRDELYRLDFNNLQNLIKQINILKQSKTDLPARQQLQGKLYGILKSVSTKITR